MLEITTLGYLVTLLIFLNGFPSKRRWFRKITFNLLFKKKHWQCKYWEADTFKDASLKCGKAINRILVPKDMLDKVQPVLWGFKSASHCSKFHSSTFIAEREWAKDGCQSSHSTFYYNGVREHGEEAVQN